ncbi:hypothetical protein GMDG_03721 [Pseudogymnoascus destructans 20631-21]|uniref:RBR-type E3 ubiquitin transferase n=2 Tax=Pseudogymnoascus destructans TaxID=655981 RepID=L8GAV5_PSED2|nr:hypothetical protein GMDG_03721 [Pseudogymnoascus destructans 20631-21]
MEQLHALFEYEARLERQQQLAEERSRLERQRVAAVENSFQQQQERHLLAILRQGSERELPVENSPGHRGNVGAPANMSKGKGKNTQESPENVPNVDSQPSVVAPPLQTQGYISTSAPGKQVAPAKTPAAPMVSPPVREEVSFAAREEPPAFQKSRSVSPKSPPAYAESSSAAAARPPAAMKGSPTSAGCPPADTGGSSSRKWSLRLLRPYVTTVFKPGGRSGRGILSRRTKESTSQTGECVSCMDDFCVQEMVPLTCHAYCSPCFTLLIETSISTETSWPPKCCLNVIPRSLIMSNLHGKLKTRYETMLEERSIAIEDRVYCSKPSCGSWIPHHKIDKPLILARCARCRHKTCMICRGSYHSNGECPEDPSLRETIQCALNAGWRRCYKCNALVEHAQGCSHMTCNCKAQFCYTCGLKWKTCTCTEIELEAYLISADWRRETAASQAQIRQAAYAALDREVRADQTEHANELRETLNLLENFEERTPAQRAAEERAFAVVAEREAEQDRSRDFEVKLQRLREEMDLVHSIQQIANFDRFETENEALADAAKEELAHIDDYFHALSLEEKDGMVGEYLILLRRAGMELTDEMMNGAGKKVDMSKAIDEQIAHELRPSILKSPAELTRVKEETARYIEFFKRQGKEPTEHLINVAHRGAARRTVKMHQLAREARHDQQSDKINARLEAEQERLRAGHQTDMKWFEEIATVRDALLVQMTVDEYSL